MAEEEVTNTTTLAFTTSGPGMAVVTGVNVRVLALHPHHLDDTMSSPNDPPNPHNRIGPVVHTRVMTVVMVSTTPTNAVVGEAMSIANKASRFQTVILYVY